MIVAELTGINRTTIIRHVFEVQFNQRIDWSSCDCKSCVNLCHRINVGLHLHQRVSTFKVTPNIRCSCLYQCKHRDTERLLVSVLPISHFTYPYWSAFPWESTVRDSACFASSRLSTTLVHRVHVKRREILLSRNKPWQVIEGRHKVAYFLLR